MTTQYLDVLKDLELTQVEQAAVKRFKQEPSGRAFLPIVDILRAHKLKAAAFELLQKGVREHPDFTLARIILAREHLYLGELDKARSVLSYADKNLAYNAMAQKLSLRIAILGSDHALVKTTYNHMLNHKLLDEETRLLADSIQKGAFEILRTQVLQQVQNSGVDVRTQAWATIGRWGEGHGKKGDQGLDSLTLVNLYVGQGNLTRALAMLERLLAHHPDDQNLLARRAEIKKLASERKVDEDNNYARERLSAKDLERLEIIDKKMHLYKQLLQKLK